jgi:hypothetical protein
MVDIVVTYLNERDKQWQKEYNYWKNKEINEGKANKNNRQAFGEERIREWDCFKYWFRAVEQNCPWVNKVFLIVQNEDHLPTWINKNNPKLRIVYHDEFIPKELLPTFNAMTIGMYIPYINDLADNYIMCDDDYYFLNPIKENHFFKFNKPVHWNNKIPYALYSTNGTDGVFWQVLNNNMEFEKKFNRDKIKYGIYHLPEARKKNFEKKIMEQFKKEILGHFIISKFRHPYNLCSYMFCDLLKLFDEAVLENPYKNSCYCTLKSTLDFNEYTNKDMVCFNDTQELDDYEKTKDKMISFLKRKFPNKSSYEKE